MADEFSPIPTKSLPQDLAIQRPDRIFSGRVRLAEPATTVMTDLRQVTAVTINDNLSIEAAEKRMRQRGVRMLLVTDEDEAVIGLITSTDLQGERPVQHIQQYGGTRSEVLVSHIMTPRERMDVLCMPDVERAKVGDVIATLRHAGRQHALVVEEVNPDGGHELRGIFSASQIARQLDLEIDTTKVAETFAEIESLLR